MPTQPRPRILVSFSRTLLRAAPGSPYHPHRRAYLRAVQAAGGEPLPAGPGDERLAGEVDGVLLTGGGDVHPRYYGQEVRARLRSVDERRDRMERELALRALEGGLPLLAVCRGIQILGVALGAPLIQQLEGPLPHELPGVGAADRERLRRPLHAVRLERGSRVRELLGTGELTVNSAHHQAVARVPRGARPAAWAPDGVLEALEVPDHPFLVGVQWHPEWMPGRAGAALFDALLQACRR